MSDITVEHNPPPVKLEVLGVESWPVWEKGVSKFVWSYDTPETCYVLEGEFTVTPEGGKPMRFGPGDLVHFPQGMNCTWEVHAPVRKHYNLG